MPINISIPTQLRGVANNQDVVAAEGATIGAVIDHLGTTFPALRERLLDKNGNIPRFINIYVNGEDIRFLQDKETPVKEADEISILPMVAGG